jgi:hypothetical protein
MTGRILQSCIDEHHASALELAEAIADRLRRLEPARSVFVEADRLVDVLRELAKYEDEDEGRKPLIRAALAHAALGLAKALGLLC